MEQKELQEARTNPEFLAYLDTREKESIKSKDIKGLYEVLDTLLVLKFDKIRIDKIYEEILKISFDSIEDRLKENKKLTLHNDDLYLIRGFYEYAIEKWSLMNFQGAKELFFILTQIIDDQKLADALNIHLLSCAKNIDIDQFYDQKVKHNDNQQADEIDEVYGYFILDFQFDTEQYLKQNYKLLEQEYQKLKHLLD